MSKNLKKIETVVHASGKAKAAFLASRLTVVPEAPRQEAETYAQRLASTYRKQSRLRLERSPQRKKNNFSSQQQYRLPPRR